VSAAGLGFAKTLGQGRSGAALGGGDLLLGAARTSTIFWVDPKGTGRVFMTTNAVGYFQLRDQLRIFLFSAIVEVRERGHEGPAV